MEPTPNNKEGNFFSEEISKKENRKLKALKKKDTVWFGLGMMGLVGWSVTVPALLGAALGIWLDKTHPQSFSWTLTLLFAGIITGSTTAWYWVTKEDKEIHNDKDDNNE
ncbi:MAG: AtpZ/AtpI family protein [Chitinophagaceae bacterium]